MQKNVDADMHITKHGTALNKLLSVCGQVCDIINAYVYIMKLLFCTKQHTDFIRTKSPRTIKKRFKNKLIISFNFSNLSYLSIIIYFNNKISFMPKMHTEQSIPEHVSPFCFKYFINLGNDRFGSMTINQKTDLYQEAEKFCKAYQLEPYVAVYLENQMFQEVLRVKQHMAHSQNAISKSIGKIAKNHTAQSKIESNVNVKEQKTQSGRDRSSGSILHQSINYTVANLQQNKKQQKVRRCNSKHFEEMFKKHEQIENKKQLSRKASIQKIPFKPTINNLSRKIVDLKRSNVSKFNDCAGQKIYVKDTAKLKQKTLQKQNNHNEPKLCRSKSKVRQVRIRLQ